MGQYRKSVLPGYRQSLPKYQQTGQVDETADPLAEDIVEIFDPTGISSYDDVYRTFKNPESGFWDKTFAVAGALPIVGKFGKLAKGVQAGTKAVTKWQKAQKAVQAAAKSKPVQRVVSGLSPIASIDKKISPVSRFVAGATERAVQNIPGRTGKVVRGVADVGSLSNQNARFWKAGDALAGQRDLKPQEVENRNQYFIFDQYRKQAGGNVYDGIYNNYLNPTDMYFYATGGTPNNPGFNSLPYEVQRQIIEGMMYGGSKRNYYQDGGEEDGMDYEVYPDETSYYPDDMYDFSSQDQMVPGAAFSPNMQPVTPNYGMVGPQMPAGYTPQPTAAPQEYNGVSVVDYLNQNPAGGGSDFASRKQLATELGIKGYRGTSQQNLQLLGMLQGKDPMQQYSGSGAGSKKGAGRKSMSGPGPTQEEIAAYNQAEGQQNPYVAINPQTGQPYIFDNPQTGGIPAETDSDGNNIFPYVAGAAGAAGLGYGAYRMFRGRGAAGAPKGNMLPPPAGQKLLPSSEMAKSAQFRSNVNSGKNVISDISKKGFYTVEDLRALKSAGYKNANIEGIMSQFPKGQASQAAAQSKKAADFSKNIRNAIAPGQKIRKFGSSNKVLDAIKAGYTAAKATPALKLFRREDGGSTYSAGSFYNMGGNYPNGGNVYGQMSQNGYLPQYRYGMQDGGSAEEMYVTPEQMEMLRQQGYDFDIIG